MNLKELRDVIIETCDRALADGAELEDVEVSLELDAPAQSDIDSVWSTGPIEVSYDNDGSAAGCVLSAEIFTGD